MNDAFNGFTLAAEADKMIRERYDNAYEVLYDAANNWFVVASPKSEDEGGDVNQPTAVVCAYAEEVGDASELFDMAAEATYQCDRIAAECYDDFGEYRG